MPFVLNKSIVYCVILSDQRESKNLRIIKTATQ